MLDSSQPIAGSLPLSVEVKTVVTLEVFTLRYALAVLRAHNDNKTHAAAALGITRYTLLRLVKRATELGLGA
jgi:transcriptional regulator with PAS, ATPase and Fis domain